MTTTTINTTETRISSPLLEATTRCLDALSNPRLDVEGLRTTMIDLCLTLQANERNRIQAIMAAAAYR